MGAADPVLAALLCGGLVWVLTDRRTAWARPARPARRRGGPTRSGPTVLDHAVACEIVGVLLASGSSIPRTLEVLGEATAEPELVVAARLLRWGSGWDEAVELLPPRLVAVVAPLRSAWLNGVDPGPALRTSAATWRARRAARAREAAERLAVRLVLPLGLCLLPAFVLLGLVPTALAAAATLFGVG